MVQASAPLPGSDLFEPSDLTAANYLRASGAPADMARAVHAYNPDDHYVTAVTAYAANMKADRRAFLGYYHWRVYVATKAGPAFLGEGQPVQLPR